MIEMRMSEKVQTEQTRVPKMLLQGLEVQGPHEGYPGVEKYGKVTDNEIAGKFRGTDGIYAIGYAPFTFDDHPFVLLFQLPDVLKKSVLHLTSHKMFSHGTS